MELSQMYDSLLGGSLIGLAATLMLAFNGRVTGVSGIVSGVLQKPSVANLWNWMFLFGLLAGGFIVNAIHPEVFMNTSGRSYVSLIVAGLLVGYGTAMGGGCTSGHGVCGISRLSFRSIVATLIFMLFGFLTVQVVRLFFGGLI